MTAGGRGERSFARTRGRVTTLLRYGDRSVEELAQALGLTDNAVRAHLATLERDGFVRQAGLRRGTSKPAYSYALTPAAERLFPKAYGTLLRMLLDVLAERLPPSAVDDALREVTHRVAAGQTVPIGELRDRGDQALAVLGVLGGLAEAEEREDGFLIGGASCPLAGALPGHPEICHLAETLHSDPIGDPVAECCERGDRRRCCFAVLRLRPKKGTWVDSGLRRLAQHTLGKASGRPVAGRPRRDPSIYAVTPSGRASRSRRCRC